MALWSLSSLLPILPNSFPYLWFLSSLMHAKYTKQTNCFPKAFLLCYSLAQESKRMCAQLLLSCIQLFPTPWIGTPLSMGFPRQEYWNGLPFPPPRHPPDPGIKPTSPEASALAGKFLTTEPPGKPSIIYRGALFLP